MTSPLVGRERQLATVGAAIDQALNGRGGVVLVGGEAGIGKTSLVGAAATEAAERGALVVTGGGWDGDGVPALWPWIQVVRQVERTLDGETWARCRDAAGPGIDALVGHASPHVEGSIADGGAFFVLDAVTSLLIAASRHRPLVVVLDDLQWADAASLRLLGFLQRQLTLEAIVVLAAYRDVEVESFEHPLHDLVHDLGAAATIVRLGGLDRDAVRALLEHDVDAPDDAAVEELHRRTGGNPFFVQQTAQLWSATGSARAMAPGVRDAVDRRLARLPAACVDLLGTAALVGTEFELTIVAAASGLDAADLRASMDPAERAGLIVPLEQHRFRFVHDLVRETLVDGLESEAPRRHAAIALALARDATAAAVPSEGLAARVAHHAYSARSELSVDEVVTSLVAAASDATRRCAAEEAAGHLERAVELVPTNSPEREALALELGNAEQRAGALESARRTFLAVAAAARPLEDWPSLAEAALGLHSVGQVMTEHESIDLLTEARTCLDATSPDTAALWARVTAALSRAMTHRLRDEREESERLSAMAVERARTTGDDDALAFCLLARHDAIWKPGTASERLALMDEMTAAAQRAGNVEMELQASLLRMVALLEHGDPRGLEEQQSFTALADRARLPRFRYYAQSRRATVATLTGDFGAAREEADRASALAQQLGEVDALSVWVDQRMEIARLQRRPEEITELIATAGAPGDVHVAVLESQQALASRDVTKALARRDRVFELGMQWPRWANLIWLTFQAEIAVLAGDAEACRAARAEIEPYADLWAMLGGGVIVHGPLRYWLATLDGALGHRDAAIEGFEAAIDAANRIDARPWAALASVALAGELVSRDEPGDATRAAKLITETERAANAMAMDGALADIEVLRTPNRSASSEGATFRRDGDVWTLGFAGRSVLMADAKGLHDIHTLLACPGTDVASIALLHPEGAAGTSSPTAKALGADPVLDERARAEFRQRLEHLDAEIEEALARHADVTAERLEAERDAIVDELRRATGLGGRSRRLGDENERARKTVTARIRDVLRRLDDRHPELAAHLRERITTGSWCRYDPDPHLDWTL